MSRNILSEAKWGMERPLSALWRECFGEEARPTAYFFNNVFHPKNCLIYQVDGRIAAMLHMLPACLLENGRPVRAHYIYGAATHPDFRSRGYMRTLLRAAFYVGGRRGDRYSFLLPAGESLYDYYAQEGYQPFFEIRQAVLTADQLRQAAIGGRKNHVLLSGPQRSGLRNRLLSGFEGSALWPSKMTLHAEGLARQYGGGMVCAMTAGMPAYALCRKPENGCCTITELMAEPETLPDLACNILAAFPAESYRLQLPAASELFPGQGTPSRFGMLRPLSGPLPVGISPYLGLTLD